MGLLHGMLYLNIALATSLIQLPATPLPRFLYPMEPPTIIYPSPYEEDCWVGSDSSCWLEMIEM